MKGENFFKDLKLAKEDYPFMEIGPSVYKNFPYKIVDDFEVTDHEGNHWGTFRASVFFPKTYPKGFPVMLDMSKKFPWEDDWHISPRNGECCVCGVIEKEEVVQKGITVLEFIHKYVLRFYANQVYKKKFGHYKNGVYAHYEEGVWQALEDEFKIKDRDKIRRFLIEMRTKRGRNDVCFCESGKKFKKCHLSRIKIIENVIKGLLLE